MPKRIIVCFDGTWNTAEAEAPTNARRLYELIRPPDDAGTLQQKWYDEGVGTKMTERIRGAFGFGLTRNIQQGYLYLALTHEPGDEIFLFGFSRGAYTARSLVGLIRKCGLLRRDKFPPVSLRNLTEKEVEELLDEVIARSPVVQEAYELYRRRGEPGGADSQDAVAFRKDHSRPHPETRVKFIGVWDTVGQLGVPLKTLQFISFLNKKRYLFHDTRLSTSVVEYACHAVAIDEYRKEYAPTLWTPEAKWPNDCLQQRWFIGAHADVGGGHSPNQPLADISLQWMQEQAAARGLVFSSPAMPLNLDHRAPVTDSHGKFLFGLYKFFSDKYYRRIGEAENGNEAVDDSARKRMQDDTAYRARHPGLRNFLEH